MKRFFPMIVLLGCVAMFALGVVKLFELRFEHGDVYPPYSSLRADPLGAMAFYESLEKISGVSVKRDFNAGDKLPDEPQTVYLHLAGEPDEFDWLEPDSFQEIKNFLARGNRLVITFFPQTESYRFYYRDDETNSINSSETNSAKMTPPKPLRKKKNISGEDEQWVSLEEEWNFHAGFKKLLSNGESYSPVRVLNQTDLPLPRALDWHSGTIFTNCDSAWKTIYTRGTNAVVIERQFGKGSVVLATDSYFISNEAMEKERHADLLAWLIGGNKNIVFDEAHLGIIETGGVATLMRKYRLHGFIGALILLAGLFIWKNSTSLVPPHEEEQRDRFVTGKDSQAGFVNLLRRSLAPREVLAVCFAEWKKSTAPGGKISARRMQEAEALFNFENSLPGKERNPVDAYKKISEIFSSKSPRMGATANPNFAEEKSTTRSNTNLEPENRN